MRQELKAMNDILDLVSILRSNTWVPTFEGLRGAPNFSSFKFNDKVYGFKLPTKTGVRLYLTIKPGGVFYSNDYPVQKAVLLDGKCLDLEGDYIDIPFPYYFQEKTPIIVSEHGAHLILDFV